MFLSQEVYDIIFHSNSRFRSLSEDVLKHIWRDVAMTEIVLEFPSGLIETCRCCNFDTSIGSQLYNYITPNRIRNKQVLEDGYVHCVHYRNYPPPLFHKKDTLNVTIVNCMTPNQVIRHCQLSHRYVHLYVYYEPNVRACRVAF